MAGEIAGVPFTLECVETRREPSLRKLLLFAAGVVLLLYLLPGGDWMLTQEERAGIERTERAERTISALSTNGAAYELGRAYTYAHGCDLTVDYHALQMVYGRHGFEEQDILDGGRLRNAWLGGVQEIGELIVLSEGDQGKRAMLCALAIANFGDDGRTIPMLLR